MKLMSAPQIAEGKWKFDPLSRNDGSDLNLYSAVVSNQMEFRGFWLGIGSLVKKIPTLLTSFVNRLYEMPIVSITAVLNRGQFQAISSNFRGSA